MIARLLHILLLTAGLGAPAIAQTLDPLPGAIQDFPEKVRMRIRAAYDEAIRQPGDPARVGGLGMLLHAHELLRAAELCYQKAQALEPTGFQWFYLSGVTQAELGEQTRAIALFRAALALDRNHLPARLRLADALLRDGSLESSHEEYSRLVQRAPELALAHYGLGRISGLRGDAETAARHHRRAIELVPQFGAAHYGLALAYRDGGQTELARKHLKAYDALGPGRPTLPDAIFDRVVALRATGRDLLADAARLGSAGRLEESIARHLAAIAADPTAAAQAHVNLISLYGRTGNTDEAERHYRAALALGTSLVDAHYNYGVLLLSTGRRNQAADMFRQVLQLNPFHAQSHNNLAALLAGQRELTQAVAHYLQAIAIDPEHRAARGNLGRTLIALGRPEAAIPHLERALALDERDAPTLSLALATAWLAANDPAKAHDYAQSALHIARARGEAQLAVRIDGFLRTLKSKRQ